jgi:hypothetical protein
MKLNSIEHVDVSTVELHLSRYTGTANYLDMQKIQIYGLFFAKSATF